MVSNLQIRAARALLGWSQTRLAEEADVSVITVKRLEAPGDVLSGRFETVQKVVSALEAAGVVFLGEKDGHRHGVHLPGGPP